MVCQDGQAVTRHHLAMLEIVLATPGVLVKGKGDATMNRAHRLEGGRRLADGVYADAISRDGRNGITVHIALIGRCWRRKSACRQRTRPAAAGAIL